MPATAWTSGDARVTSWPSNMIWPVVTGMSPAMQLKKVDLPAPFGPIRPMISPVSTVRLAPATARKLPQACETFIASSSMTPPPPFGRNPVPESEQASRLKARNQDNDAAVENEGQSGASGAEPGIGCRLQRNEDQRADHRSEERASAAQRGNDYHLHRDENAEAAFRIDEAS